MSASSGTSAVSVMSSSLLPTTLVTSVLSSSLLSTATRSGINGTGESATSSASATATPWHYVQPPPDKNQPSTIAPVTVATVLFAIGVLFGIGYFIQQRKVKKREAIEARLSHEERERLAAKRRAKKRRLGEGVNWWWGSAPG